MKNTRPIFWHQGLFLQPQHLQLSDLYTQSLLTPLTRLAHPHLWGMGSFEVNGNALANGSFALDRAEMVFPDGSYLEFPGNAVIQPRTFDEEWMEQGKPLKVFLGLRKWDQSSENVTVLANLEDVSGVNTRFVTTADPEEVSDLYQEAPAARVKRLSYVPKIFWETEKDQLSHYLLIPVAEVEVEGKQVKHTSRFIPPSLGIESSEILHTLVKDLFDKLSARCRRLEEYKSPRGMGSSGLEPGVLLLALGLRTLSRYVLLLSHLMGAGQIHPWTVYGVLSQLVGELSTFSTSLSATGEGKKKELAVPPYDHHDLYKCFSTMHQLVGQLLDEITFGPESIIRLVYEEPYYQAAVEQKVFSDRNVYYLSVNTSTDHKLVREAMESVAKLSARENLPILIERSLSGIGLEYVPIPPPGLPQIPTAIYFRVDAASAQWNDVQKMGNIALHWDSAPADLVAEIIVLRRK